MAIFQYIDARMHELDWRLLQNGPITLYNRREILEDDLSWLRDHDYQIDPIDCKDWLNDDDFYDAISTQLAFPAYFGRNLDALSDCLYDLEIPENSGRVLVFYQYDRFVPMTVNDAEIVLDILAFQARYHLLFGRRLMVLVQSNNPELSFNRVGGCPVSWNNREWLNKDRGL